LGGVLFPLKAVIWTSDWIERRLANMEKKVRSPLSWKLIKRRKELDLINQQLLTLLNQRLRISLEVGKVKREMGKKIYDTEREKEILDRLKRKNRGPLKEKDLKEIFATIMKVCRQSQFQTYRPSKPKDLR
jgi:chorismate mutase